jgi:hypothetical protein
LSILWMPEAFTHWPRALVHRVDVIVNSSFWERPMRVRIRSSIGYGADGGLTRFAFFDIFAEATRTAVFIYLSLALAALGFTAIIGTIPT